MHFSTTLLNLVFAAVFVNARPTQRALFESVSLLDDALVFDAAGFPDPAKPGNTLVGLQSFVSLRQIDLGSLIDKAGSLLESTVGLDIGDNTQTVEDRIRLFGAVGLPGKKVEVKVDGCGNSAKLGPTSGLPDLGMALQNVSIGQCGGGKALSAKVKLGSLDKRTITATVFNSPDSGFGVISGD